ncbi:hypothetical protein ACWEQ7_23460 [Streptomyces sp. NPDC004069]
MARTRGSFTSAQREQAPTGRQKLPRILSTEVVWRSSEQAGVLAGLTYLIRY